MAGRRITFSLFFPRTGGCFIPLTERAGAPGNISYLHSGSMASGTRLSFMIFRTK